MAGRIHDDDIALVRERARIEDVVASHVTLHRRGADLEGLCPFHDEKTPSFHVTPARGFYYCFGCGEGGDVIKFEQTINNLSFAEAIQALADRVGVQLRIVDDGTPQLAPGLRVRIMEANQAAEEFYSAQLLTAEGVAARRMLDGRGFDKAAAEHFGVGYAPKAGRELHQHLTREGFSDAELIKAGLIRENGGWDFFQGRVIWPIRDSARSVLGFGGRRLYDDDRLPAKYINTPDTPVYKKSSVLYGLDLARQSIAKKSQAVVMEGYTDVMAAHLSGIDTAVAVCGTAFGADHARLLQRLMGNHDAFQGEVIFTFDGDQAGQNAALKVFSLDAKIVAQTYVAVEPGGLDPCDLRLQQGDAAVRDLVGRRLPLYRFVMTNLVARFDLDRADGRLAAVRAAAPMINSIRDGSLVSGYVRELAQVVGMDVEEVRKVVSQVARRQVTVDPGPSPSRARVQATEDPSAPALDGLNLPWPDASDRNLAAERGTLKLMLQYPTLFDSSWNGVQPSDFTHPSYRAVYQAILSVPFSADQWTAKVQQATHDETVAQLEVALLVEPVLRTPDEAYAAAYAGRLQLLTVLGQIREVKSRLQRTNPVEHRVEYDRTFSALLELETLRKQLQQLSLGLSE